MDPFNPTIEPHIPADMNRNPIALLGLQMAPGVYVPVGGVTMGDGTFAAQVAVGTGVAAVASAALSGPVGVTGAAVQILAADTGRKGHTLTNTGAKTVYLGFDGTVTSANGIPLASGASISLDLPGVAYTGAIWGICAAADTSEIRARTYA